MPKPKFRNLAEALRALMADAAVSQAELARRTGVSQATISRILAGETLQPDFGTLQRLADALNRNVTDLHSGAFPAARESDAYNYTSAIGVPVYEWSALKGLKAGEAPSGDVQPLAFVAGDRSKLGSRAFAVRLQTDAMARNGAGHDFPEGAIILVDPARKPEPGQFVLVRLDRPGSESFRQWIVDGGRVFLAPLNPRYQALELPATAHVLGVAVQSTINLL
jgi:SOS-response transcriptional repressor LexA